MENVPNALNLTFIIVSLLSIWLMYNATHSKTYVIIVSFWAGLQFLIGSTQFYTKTDTLPPRFLLLIAPPLIGIAFLFFTQKGKKFLDSFNFKYLLLIHSLRIPVEIALYYLFMAKTIPQIMTFEGRNFDIIAGISALIIFFLYEKIPKNIRMIWNVAGIILLLNIVIIAILSVNTAFQQFGFDQPNIAIAYFPYNWLAGLIVPQVLLAHLASIRNYLKA